VSRRRSTSPGGLEYEAKPAELFNLATGAYAIGVHVRWRPAGVRRFESFHIWPDEGQSLADLLKFAGEAADKVYAAGGAERGKREATS